MGNPKTTIELNGKHYDARTGRIISESEAIAAHTRHTTTKPNASQGQGQILDGFVRRAPTKPALKGSQKSNTAAAAAKSASRKPEKSRTLMRPTVKKPSAAVVKNDIQAVKSPIKQPVQHTTQRHVRAEAASRSPFISRFGTPRSSVVKKEAHLPVVTPSTSVAAPSLPSIKNAVSNELQRLEHALQDANAHLHQLEDGTVKKIPFLRRVGFRNKYANVAALSCAFLLLVGFFAYQNQAAISMKVAASKSGVHASLPGYKPAGYAVNGGVKSEAGKVSITYKSNTDSKSYTLVQESSNWNSTALLANHVTKTRCSTCYQTWQNDGKTVYIYDNSNATWVNGGVWYRVEGNADLTSDQLLRLANSL